MNERFQIARLATSINVSAHLILRAIPEFHLDHGGTSNTGWREEVHVLVKADRLEEQEDVKAQYRDQVEPQASEASNGEQRGLGEDCRPV